MRGMTTLIGAFRIVTFLSLLLGDAHLFKFLVVCTALAPIVGWRDMRLHARVCNNVHELARQRLRRAARKGFDVQRLALAPDLRLVLVGVYRSLLGQINWLQSRTDTLQWHLQQLVM